MRGHFFILKHRGNNDSCARSLAHRIVKDNRVTQYSDWYDDSFTYFSNEESVREVKSFIKLNRRCTKDEEGQS